MIQYVVGPLMFCLASSVGRVRTFTKLLKITIVWGMIRMNRNRSQVDASEFDKNADTYVIKMHISENIQNESEVSSTLPLLMRSMYCEFKMRDAMYTPASKAMTPMPNLRVIVDSGVFNLDDRNPMMHAKYNTMHESRMMEETAPMLVVATSSTQYLTMYPAIGKNANDFSNVSLLMDMIIAMDNTNLL